MDSRLRNKTGLKLTAWRKKRETFPSKKNVHIDYSNEVDLAMLNCSDSAPIANLDDNIEVSVHVSIDTTNPSKETINIDECNKSPHKLEGRRIVNINFFLKSIFELSNHCPRFNCTLQNLQFKKEERSGFISTMHFECNMCNGKFAIHTSDDIDDDINKDSVLAMMSIGSGFSHLEQISSSLDLPCMSSRMYNNLHDVISDKWEDKCLQTMKEAAEEEKSLAIAAGEIDKNGNGMITVVVDGSWAKRSYRNNYNSLSGAAAIIGYKTKKVLYMGVRNKFCTVCKSAETKNAIPKEHKCYKNWTGSSSSMEGDILAEGFVKSQEMYGLIYSRVIADGDSNTYKKILDAHPYDNVVVKKIECKNHLMRNYYKKLREIAKDTTAGSLSLRKEIQKNHMRLGWAVTKAITHQKQQNVPFNEKVENLQKDIDNSLSHVFGEHRLCQKIGYFCNEAYVPNGSVMSKIQATGLYDKLLGFKNQLRRHASSLIYDVNSNCVEQFNSIIAKFIGGKRINYCKKRSYQSRCAAAVVSHNTRRPIYTIKKHIAHGISPGKYCKKLEQRNMAKNAKRKTPAVRRKLNFSRTSDRNDGGDKHYGENCEKPDMPIDEFNAAKEKFLKSLEKNEDGIKEIERMTRDQQNSDLWYLERRKRLTASQFGNVCRRRPTTSCKVLVESIIYPKEFFSEACEHGKRNEIIAKKQLEGIISKNIETCGLFVDKQFPFLAASPDGLIEEKGIVEIKCPWSSREITPQDAIEKKFITFWTGEKINTNHKWYYQIQGQLRISDRAYCIFAVWTPHGIKSETIFRDDSFWKNKMESNLINFYNDCILPELVDPRRARNMRIKDPCYIEEAIQSKKRKL